MSRGPCDGLTFGTRSRQWREPDGVGGTQNLSDVAMSKPVILTVDDEPDVLNAIERDLYAHFRTQ